jgi:hypothetical protein
MPEEKLCAFCQTPFKPNTKQQKYCNPRCTRQHEREKRRLFRGEERKCLICGGVFFAKVSNKKYCSVSCRRMAEKPPKLQMPPIDASAVLNLFLPAKEGEKSVVLADSHIPFQDDKTLSAVESFIEDFLPDKLFYLGDLIDFYSISSFNRNPLRSFKIADELRLLRLMLRRHRGLVGDDTEIIYVLGNHEKRLTWYLQSQASDLAGLDEISLEGLFHTKQLNIKLVEYGGAVRYADYLLTHGTIVSKQSGYTAKRMMDMYKMNGISAHTHRRAIITHSMGWKETTWIEAGYLAKPETTFTTTQPNWSQAFVYAEVLDGVLRPTLVPVNIYGFVANGKYYRRNA